MSRNEADNKERFRIIPVYVCMSSLSKVTLKNSE